MKPIAISIAVIAAGVFAGAGARAQSTGNSAASGSAGAGATLGTVAAPSTPGSARAVQEPRRPAARDSAGPDGTSTRTLDLRSTGSIGAEGRR